MKDTIWRESQGWEDERPDELDGRPATIEKAEQALSLLRENALLKNRIEELEALASSVPSTPEGRQEET